MPKSSSSLLWRSGSCEGIDELLWLVKGNSLPELALLVHSYPKTDPRLEGAAKGPPGLRGCSALIASSTWPSDVEGDLHNAFVVEPGLFLHFSDDLLEPSRRQGFQWWLCY